MGTVAVSAERAVGVPAGTAYTCLSDYHQHHHRFLPPAFSNFTVEEGGTGAGTVVRFTVTAGGRVRDYRMAVDEPEPGRVLRETDTGSTMVTTFTVTPEGAGSRVRIDTSWAGAGGVGGIFERLFAPRVLRGIYVDELDRFDAYARGVAGGDGGTGGDPGGSGAGGPAAG